MGICCCLLDQQTSSHQAEMSLFERVSSTIRRHPVPSDLPANPARILERCATMREVSFFYTSHRKS